MPLPPITYRTNDGTKWGAGKGSNLTPTDVDDNFYNLDRRINALETTPPVAISITGFEVVGENFYVNLSDSTTVGPYALPVARLNWLGEWQPTTVYALDDVVTVGNSVYYILRNHISAATFDAGANGGPGLDYYKLAFVLSRVPAIAVPEVSTAGVWTPIVGDEQKFRIFSDAAIVLLANDAQQPFGTDDEIYLYLIADGTSGGLLIEWPTDVTVHVPDGFLPELLGVGAAATLKKLGANEWALIGLLKTA